VNFRLTNKIANGEILLSGSVIGINEKARENTKVHPEKG
jgi:hypothetical protein